MIDINEEKAKGEALDIRQGVPFCTPCSIYAGSYEDAKDSDIVIITSGIARKPGQTRLDLAQTNVNIIKSITPNITKYAPDAIYLFVSNPVDILTYTFCKCSGIPESRIIGSGTILDTARLRARLSEYYQINQQNVHAYVLGVPFCTPCSIYAGSYEDAKDSDIVIITSGIARKPGQTRLDLAQTNVNIIKSITPNITKYAPDAIYLFVSNPVDILTYTFCKCSGIPESRIIGSGTILDTARLRARLSEYYQINQQNVHAYVLGEHGDSSFVPWSVANISNIPANAYQKAMENTDGMLIPPLNYADVEDYMRKSGGNVIKRKGATFYAVSISVCHIVKCILSGIDTNMTVSTMLNGEYGISDVCLSLLTTVGHKGVVNKLNLPLTESEHAALVHSSECLKEIIKKVQI